MTSADKPESRYTDGLRRSGYRTRRTAATRIPNQRRELDRRPPPPAFDVASPPDVSPSPDVSPDKLAAFDVQALRELARSGGLGAVAGAADDALRRRLFAAAYTVAYPIVFKVVTQKVERRREHGRCMRNPQHLVGPCLDGFYDDVEATIEHLFAARTPIDDLEAWLAYWAPKAAVNSYRKRRGSLGALQRPRMTKALAELLGDDRWLKDLALQILTWVGISATAGAEVWPLDEWAQRRAMITGEFQASTPAVVAVEVAHVLELLRQRPDWYAEHVERPLSHKPVPIAATPGDEVANLRSPAEQHEIEDRQVTALAWTALEAITEGLRSNRDPTETVIRVLTTLFLGGSGAETISQAPGTGPAHEERVSALLADPAALAGVVDRVLRIVREVEQ